MRIVGLVLLVSLLATLGLLACLAPVATPAPAATPTPAATLGFPTDVPTATPSPTPRLGQALLSTETVNYGPPSLDKYLELKTGDVVVFTYNLTGPGAYIEVDDPQVPAAAALQRTSFINSSSGTRSFEAKLDGKYRLRGGVAPGAGLSSIVLKIDIYR
ncbi:MAG: hypothetical protein KJ624_02595 [Chloroflexi bacterium]|nr:hypothetical protein [Chloroflexota bacterium]